MRFGAGGHDIPDDPPALGTSRRNIIKLMPHLAELEVFYNSAEGDPAKGAIPQPRLLLHIERGNTVAHPHHSNGTSALTSRRYDAYAAPIRSIIIFSS